MRIGSVRYPLIFLLLALASCKTNTPDTFKMVVGEWRIDHVEMASNATQQMLGVANRMPNRSRIVYRADSTYQAEILDQLAGGKWYLDSNNQVLVTVTSQAVTNRMLITKLDAHQMVLRNITGELDYTLSMVPYDPKGRKQ